MKPQKTKDNKAQKAIIFDSGTLISFSMNGMTEIIKSLKGIFHGRFLITPDVKREIIDVPLKIKKFELEALKIENLLSSGVLELPSSMDVSDAEIKRGCYEVMDAANSAFSGMGKDIHIVDFGEASCMALSKILTKRGVKNVIAVDERTTRLLAEKPENLKDIFESRMNTKITIKKQNTAFFKDFKILRSAELAYVAFKKGLVDLKDGNVLDALLYAMKFKGAAISSDEIHEIEMLR